MSTTIKDSLVEEICKNIASYDVRTLGPYPETPAGFKRAAVLLPLAVRNGEIYILLTKRSKHLRSHPSTVSFPGGSRDESDTSDIETALRESEEEIGLPPDQVKILGILTRGATFPPTVVYPIVGLIPETFEPKPNPQEVEFAFFVPLADFLREDRIHFKPFNVKGKPYQSRCLDHETEHGKVTVWGFTANFCVLLAHIVYKMDKPVLLLDGTSPSKPQSKSLYYGFEEYFDFVVSMSGSRREARL